MGFLKNYLDKVVQDNQKEEAIAFFAAIDSIAKVSKTIANSIIQELKDQRENLKLIASENFSSLSVQLAMGNLLTDKYSEGYVKHRFYAGCDNVDEIEYTAIEEAKKLFNCEHAYVQPHSGADANLVAFWSILVHKVQNKEVEKLSKTNVLELSKDEYEKIRQLLINQKIMGMSLNSGGHLTHGYRLNVSSKFMKSYEYEVDPKTGLLDYAQLKKQAKQIKPLILLAGYSAYPRKIDFSKLKEIADEVGAVLMVDMAHFAGLVAGKVFKNEFSPIDYADIVTTTTHKTLRGPRGGMILCKEEYKEVVDKGCPLILGGPMPHVMAAKAIAFKEANTIDFQKYAFQIVENAQAFCERFIQRGAFVLTKGTDNHLILLDVNKSFNLTGRQAESLLRESNITVNRNAIPLDTNGPWYTSGVRLGTPAVTTLGMKKEQMYVIADVIYDLLKNAKPSMNKKISQPSRSKAGVEEKILKEKKQLIKEILEKFKLYPQLVI